MVKDATLASMGQIVWRLIERHDIAPEPLFRAAGIDPAIIHDPHAHIPRRASDALVRALAKRIPDPVTVDLKKILSTSELVNMSGDGKKKQKPLPSIALIEQEVQNQQSSKDSHRLVETNLAIWGKGTNVLLTSAQVLQDLAQRTQDVRNTTSSANPPPQSPPPPVSSPPPGPSPAKDVGPFPQIFTDGDKKTEERYGDNGHPIKSPLVLNRPQDFSKNGGYGSVQIESNDSVTVNTMVKVSDANISRKRGSISIHSRKPTGTAISITSSGQLLALLAATNTPGGNIALRSDGGGIGRRRLS